MAISVNGFSERMISQLNEYIEKVAQQSIQQSYKAIEGIVTKNKGLNKKVRMRQSEQEITLHRNQQQHRSMIPHSENPVPSMQAHIDDILALELSDTLINAAYHLSAMKIQLAIQKICVLQRYFVQNMAWGFEGITQWGNRRYKKRHNLQDKNYNKEIQQENITYSADQRQRLTVLTKQQQQQKVLQQIIQKLSRLTMIITNKHQHDMYYAFCKLEEHDIHCIQELRRKSFRQVNKFQPINAKQIPYKRRSIQKDSVIKRTTYQQCSFSLNKNYQPSTVLNNKTINKSNNNNISKASKYEANICATKSTCSQSSAQQDTTEYCIYMNSNKFNRVINENSEQSSKKDYYNSLVNSSNLSIQQKQLVTLRTKYQKLVHQFRQFSSRFLSVIKEE